MSTVEILDVGLGNCSLISSKDEYAIVDSPRRDPLLSLLKDRGITRIGAVVVSHADADHLRSNTMLHTSTMTMTIVAIPMTCSTRLVSGGLLPRPI